jgi:hypothetical protein
MFAQPFSNNGHVLLREIPRERMKRTMGSDEDPSEIVNKFKIILGFLFSENRS